MRQCVVAPWTLVSCKDPRHISALPALNVSNPDWRPRMHAWGFSTEGQDTPGMHCQFIAR